jgi:hypothetical protein
MAPIFLSLNSLSFYYSIKPILINNYSNINKIPPKHPTHSIPEKSPHEISNLNSIQSNNNYLKLVKNLTIIYLNFARF